MIKLIPLLLFLTRALQAVTLSSGNDQFSRACDIVSWSDSAGQNRSVWIVKGTPGAFISKMTYFVGATSVTAQVPTTGFAFCTLVNHHTDSFGGAYTSSNGLSNPPSLYSGGSTYRAGVTPSVPFAGAHHLIWRGTLQMYSHPWASSEAWFITVQYVFTDGRDDFIFSNAYDSGEMVESTLNSTNLSPYSDFDFDGDGGTAEGQSGIGMGTLYKFRTNVAAGSLGLLSGWTYNQANTIPHAWMFKDLTKNDREMGVVQNQPYSEKDAGYNGYGGAFPAPPYASTAGQRLPNLTDGNAYQLPFQMNVYADYAGQRFTWGTTYQAFRNNHTDGLNTNSIWDVYPVNGSSFNVLVDAYSSNGVPNLITDTERIYASTLTAGQGSVVLSGPKGPGSYLSPQTATMPTRTYSHPGFDFLFRAWRFNAPAGGNAVLNLNAGGALSRPSFIIQQFPAASPCRVLLDGAIQNLGIDYEFSYDSGSQQLYLTFLKTVAQGARVIEVDAACGSPTFTPTICAACSPTFSSTFTPTLTATPTLTPSPACAPLLVDNLEDANSLNMLGGVWSTWAGAPATTSAFSVAAGYPLSPYGPVGSAHSSGSNSGTQVGSMSTSFSPQIDLGSKDRLIFWINATGGSTSFHVNVQRAAITDFDHYGATFTAPAGAWTRIEIPLATMAQAGWGLAKPMAWNDVTGLTFFSTSTGAYSLNIDDVSFGCPSPPTATPSLTLTRSFTQTPTASLSATQVPAGSSPSSTPTPGPAVSSCPADSFGSFLKAGDKVLFLGDSITYRGNFTKMVQAHLQMRFPSAGFTFVNQGGPGDAGLQVWNRRAAVLAQNPNVVLLCLGMNDAYNPSTYQADFPYYMNQIVTYLQGFGIRVALLTPGICDLSLPFTPMAPDYNTRLAWEANWVMTYAASKGLPVYNINSEMAAADAAMKAALPGSCMIPDSVHPDPAGGWVMGLGALKALGVPDRCGEIAFSPGSVACSNPLLGSGATASGFDLQLNTLPPVAPAAARKILPYEPLQKAVNHLGLKASGLPAASYYIVIDGHRSGPVGSSALAAGVNLYDFWIAPGSSPGELHHVDFLDASGQPAYACDPGASDGLIDNFESPAPGLTQPNLWGGDLWALDPGKGSSIVSPSPLAYAAPGFGGTGSCMRISGNADASFPPVLISYLNGLNADVKQGIRFQAKGIAGKQVRFQIHSWAEKRMSPESWNDYGFTFSFAATGVWQQVSIPYSSLALPSWGPTPYYPFVPQEIYNLDWLPVTAGAFDIAIDDVEFYCTGSLPSPTPSRTVTATYTASATATQSPTASATRTPSFTSTASLSASPSPTQTASATGTGTLTQTPSVTQTDTPPPPGSTFTNTPTNTATPTFTGTPTQTPTMSPTFSHSPTPSTTPTWSSTGSPSPTLSSSPTFTPTTTFTGTLSQTPTGSMTASLTISSSPNPTLSATQTASATRTPSPASSPSFSPTPTLSASPSPVSSATQSPTMTLSPTAPAGTWNPTQTTVEGPLVITDLQGLPNPNPHAFMLKLSGPSDRCSITIYSKAMARLGEFSAPGANGPGWVQVPANLADFSNGSYYFTASAERAGRRSEKLAPGKLFILK